ncbi:MAG TPA: alpha/beta fold hydrolase [Acidimicrobiales bacterium]
MRTVEIHVDVTGIAGLAEPLATAATAYLSDVCPASCPVVFAFPGGGYSRRYYDLTVNGDRSYSQARHHTDRGMVVVACDHLCTGEATMPADPFAVTLEQLAEANAITADTIAEQIRTGTLAADVPPTRISASVGIGQSMGGCILTVHQGQRPSFDAVAFLGSSGRHTAFPDPTGGTVPITVPARGADLHDAPMPDMFTPDLFRYCFHHDDVPEEVVDLDLGANGNPWRSLGAPPCAISMLSPGVVAAEAAAITVPVLVVCGERDVVPDPHAEPAAYPGSPDITLVVMPKMAHMHNFAGTRQQLWDRLADWVGTVVDYGVTTRLEPS